TARDPALTEKRGHRPLEAVAQPDPHLALGEGAVQSEYPHEVAARQAARRVRELRRVGDVGGFDPRFQPVLATNRESAEQGQVEIPATGTAELVDQRVAEPDAGGLRP